LRAAFGWEPEIAAWGGGGTFVVLVLVRVEEAVAGAGKVGEFGFVGYPAEVGFVRAVIVDGVDVDCAGGCCCAGGFGGPGRDCFGVFLARHGGHVPSMRELRVAGRVADRSIDDGMYDL
jgi:hypothetical protein